MFKVPYDQILSSIEEKTGHSKEEIETKVKAKLAQLSGLISKEGAAHIVANELGVKLLDPSDGKLQIKNIQPGMRNLETAGKVLQVYEVKEFNTGQRQGKLGSFLMGDETGRVRVVLWGAQADNLEKIKPDDIVKLSSSYAKDNQGRTEIHVNDRAVLEINPEGVEVKGPAAGPPDGQTSGTPKSERKDIAQITENDQFVEIMGTLVQVFEPRFFPVDPETGRKVQQKDGKFYSGEKEITPGYSYVLNGVIDDGTETIRAVFFREQAEALLKQKPEEIQQYRDNPAAFADKKNELLGTILKLNAKVSKNTFFDRLEVIARDVTPDPDPKEELKQLNQ